MKIALTRRNKNKTTLPQLFHLNKRTCQIKTARLVPAFTASWHSIRKISSAQMKLIRGKINKTSATQRKQHPPYNKKCRNQKTQSKGHYILQPELKYA